MKQLKKDKKLYETPHQNCYKIKFKSQLLYVAFIINTQFQE